MDKRNVRGLYRIAKRAGVGEEPKEAEEAEEKGQWEGR